MNGIPDNPATRSDMADYLESARVLDESFGEVMEALREGGHGDNTIIFFTTDHGPAFPGMKCTLREDGTNVALIMDYPGNPSRGKLNDALVANIDVMPTIFDLLGWEKPSHFSGNSLRPLLDGKADSVRDEVFYAINFHTVYEPVRGLRRRRHKLIRHFRPGAVCLDNIDPGPTKTWMLDHGLAEMPIPEYELYDLDCDAGETNNLAFDPKFSDLLGAMKSRLEEIMVETDDPLLKGEISAPEGAILGVKES